MWKCLSTVIFTWTTYCYIEVNEITEHRKGDNYGRSAIFKNTKLIIFLENKYKLWSSKQDQLK